MRKQKATTEDLDTMLAMLRDLEQQSKYEKIKFFTPDTWQVDAIKRGKTEKVRGVICGNR